MCVVDMLRAKNMSHHRRLIFNNASFLDLRQVESRNKSKNLV